MTRFFSLADMVNTGAMSEPSKRYTSSAGVTITAPATRYVLDLLRWNPDGMCRRTFANHDVWEVSARVGELERAGFTVSRRPCNRHNHRTRVVEYRLGTWPT